MSLKVSEEKYNNLTSGLYMILYGKYVPGKIYTIDSTGKQKVQAKCTSNYGGPDPIKSSFLLYQENENNKV